MYVVTQKLLQYDRSFQVQSMVPVWGQVILRWRVETDKIIGEMIVNFFKELKGSDIIFFQSKNKVYTEASALHCTLSHLI